MSLGPRPFELSLICIKLSKRHRIQQMQLITGVKLLSNLPSIKQTRTNEPSSRQLAVHQDHYRVRNPANEIRIPYHWARNRRKFKKKETLSSIINNIQKIMPLRKMSSTVIWTKITDHSGQKPVECHQIRQRQKQMRLNKLVILFKNLKILCYKVYNL